STSNEPILEWNLLEGTNDEEEIFLETGNLMESSNYDKVLGTLEKNLLEDGKLEGIQCQFLDKHRQSFSLSDPMLFNLYVCPLILPPPTNKHTHTPTPL
ncbi:hypothetical protein HMI55_001534, partial [Coelomomyces lativittatus]